MSVRPSPAQWFEVLVPREDAHTTLETLARGGRVQFEWRGDRSATEQVVALREPIHRYRALRRDAGRYWPKPVFEKRCCPLPVELAAAQALSTLEQWLEAAQPLLMRLQVLRLKREQWKSWGPVLTSLHGVDIDLRALANAGPWLLGFCLVLPAEARAPPLAGSLHTEIEGETSRTILGVAAAAELARLRSAAESLGGRCLPVPGWLLKTPGASGERLPDELAAIEQRHRHLEQAVGRLAAKHAVAGALGVLERLEWFLRTAEDISCDEEYCWITGWTSESDAQPLNRALSDAGVRPCLRFVVAPSDVFPPSVTRNPIWLQPFELFTRAIGVPGVHEADPTTWVALLVPLMFGYMCGDLGHGLVMIAAGLYLRRRWTWGWLLVFGGAAAAVFGVIYGDVFGFETVLSPLWIRPLQEPLIILAVPVVAGALVLTLGILLHWVESCWRAGEPFAWLADLAQLLVYWGIILVVVDPGFGWLAVAGVILCAARLILIERSPRPLPAGFGLLLENSYQLLLNTLSFVRVGAFALAHAGLATTVILLAEGLSSTLGSVIILLIGNLLIILLEGMVVSIQTTRLILFEFFVRFFEGTGRQFQPAAHPPTGPASKETGPARASRRVRLTPKRTKQHES